MARSILVLYARIACILLLIAYAHLLAKATAETFYVIYEHLVYSAFPPDYLARGIEQAAFLSIMIVMVSWTALWLADASRSRGVWVRLAGGRDGAGGLTWSDAAFAVLVVMHVCVALGLFLVRRCTVSGIELNTCLGLFVTPLAGMVVWLVWVGARGPRAQRKRTMTTTDKLLLAPLLTAIVLGAARLDPSD